MGLTYRKSVKAGPFRFNVSRSGIGGSAGVGGVRMGTGPRGNYVSVSTHGVRYRTTVSGGAKGRRPTAGRRRPTSPASPPAGPGSVVVPGLTYTDTTGASIEELAAAGQDALVTQLNAAANWKVLSPWVWTALLILTVTVPPVGLVLDLLALPLLVWLYLRDQAHRRVPVLYEVTGSSGDWFSRLHTALTQLATCQGLWRINALGDLQTRDGTTVVSQSRTLSQRDKIVLGFDGDRLLRANLDVPALTCGRDTLLFLPDRLILRNGRSYAAIAYQDLQVTCTTSDVLETGAPPSDGQVVGTTWRHTTVKGLPDRRFKDNPTYHYLRYAELTLTSDTGFRWLILASQVPVADALADVFSLVPARLTTPPEPHGESAARGSEQGPTTAGADQPGIPPTGAAAPVEPHLPPVPEQSAPLQQPPTPALPPPGWHPDPYRQAKLRWWDGTRWTEHTHTG